mgnify:CR=1 FL=1
MTAATYTLPKPISVNKLRGGRSNVITEAYKRWNREVGWMLKAQNARPMKPPYEVHIAIEAGCKIDVDNAPKAILDALETAGVLTNDRMVNRLVSERSDNPITTVTITET